MTHLVRNQEKTRNTQSCLLYTRVSSKEQNEEGYSLAAQEKLLRDYAAQNALRIVAEFQDVETAKRTGRSAFSDMLVHLRRHKSCRVILVEKTDRLYRNIRDWVTLDDLDVEVHFVKEGIVLSDQSRSSEKFIHGIKVLMAKNYCDNLSEETSKGMRQKASEGIWPSRAPLGYRNVMGEDGKRTIEPDPETGPIVTRLFKSFATGRYTQRELTKLAADMGLTFSKGTRISKSYVLGILKNPLYMGEFVWNGERFRGRYEPLIDRETWEAAQEAFENRKKGRLYQDTSRWIFARLLRCSHCECAMVGEEKKGVYVYYHCTKNRGECPAAYVREEKVALAFWKSLQAIRLRPEIADWLVTALKQSATDHREFTEKQMDALVGRMKDLRRRLDLIYKDRLDGRITENQYVDFKQGLEKDVMEAEAKIEGLNRADFKFYDKGVELLELVQRAVNAWESSDRSQKRVLLETVHSNCLWDGERAIPEYRQPFDLIALALAGEKEKAAPEEAALCDLEKWLPCVDGERGFKPRFRPGRLYDEGRVWAYRERRQLRLALVAPQPRPTREAYLRRGWMKNPLVVAQEIRAAFDENTCMKKVTQSMVAERFGMSRSRVAQYVGLLRLPDDVVSFVVAPENEEYVAHLTEGNLRSIAAMPDPIRQRRAFAGLLSGTSGDAETVR